MQNKRLAIGVSTAIGACVAAVLMFSGTSYAHVEPSPIAVEAGKSATVSFMPAHGCDGSPTIKLAFKVPASVTDAAPVTKSGWQSATKDGVVTFSGGSLDATIDTEPFDITFTAPAEAGTIFFPVVQTCEKGQINWIDQPNADGSEAEFGAPAIKVTAGPPTSADLLAPEEATDGTVTATADSGVTAEAPGEADNEPDSDNPSNVTRNVIIAVLAGAVIAVGIVVYVKRGDKID